VQAAGDRAREISMPDDREILHLLQQEFVVDEQDGVRQPVGMMGVSWKFGCMSSPPHTRRYRT